jgi:RimJ/RimL family protein N-acetyltransferase
MATHQDTVMTPQQDNGPVRIRPFRPDDMDLLFEAARESVREVSPWLPWCHAAYSRDEAARWVASRPEAWAKGAEYSFAIVAGSGGRFLGGCGLNQIHAQHRFANLGYWVRTSAAGQGIASAATLLAARFGFVELGLVRVEIVVDVDNTQSQRVAEKVNATREGVERQRLVIGGRVRDAVMFSLLPEDLGLERLPAMRSPGLQEISDAGYPCPSMAWPPNS